MSSNVCTQDMSMSGTTIKFAVVTCRNCEEDIKNNELSFCIQCYTEKSIDAEEYEEKYNDTQSKLEEAEKSIENWERKCSDFEDEIFDLKNKIEQFERETDEKDKRIEELSNAKI